MSKVAVVAPFSFIGFGLCTRLINDGLEVFGMGSDTTDEKADTQDEMRLLLGRNSNFHLCKWDEITEKLVDNITMWFVVHYGVDRSVMSKQIECLSSSLQRRSAKQSFTPKVAHILMGGIALDQQLVEPHHYIFSLPEVYGPWQPSAMLFQTCMNQPRFPFFDFEKVSNNQDALYIDDAVSAILDTVEGKPDHYSIESNIDNHFEEAMKYAGFELLSVSKQPLRVIEATKQVVWQSTCTPEEGIFEQKKHVEKLKWLREISDGNNHTP